MLQEMPEAQRARPSKEVHVAVSTKQAGTQHQSRPAARDVAREVTQENTPSSPIVEALTRQVANSFILYSNYKQYHWNTYGPLFRDLHKLFDKFAGEVQGSIDELAERIRMIGQNPPRLPELIELASVSLAAPDTNVREMVEEADRNAMLVIGEMRRAAKRADEHDDPGTVDLFSTLVQIHEKQEWWLRELLRKGDGLCG
jgi:starvation-inducible DNA-binding protein